VLTPPWKKSIQTEESTPWQADVAVFCFNFDSLDSLLTIQQRREYHVKKLNLFTALKQADRLHANQDWTGWFGNSLWSLK
jgi:hypothetical protein